MFVFIDHDERAHMFIVHTYRRELGGSLWRYSPGGGQETIG